MERPLRQELLRLANVVRAGLEILLKGQTAVLVCPGMAAIASQAMMPDGEKDLDIIDPVGNAAQTSLVVVEPNVLSRARSRNGRSRQSSRPNKSVAPGTFRLMERRISQRVSSNKRNGIRNVIIGA